VEVRTPAGQRIIIDGGTGVRELGRFIRVADPDRPVEATLLLSHYHWDHIQGLPFSPILYDPRNHLSLYGLRPDSPGGMAEVLEGQMSGPYFPVDLKVLAAARQFTELEAGAALQVGDVLVRTGALHHPQGCLGFRIETSAGVVVYASDNEPGDPAGDRSIRELAQDADIFICDAQFAPEFLQKRRGWGHSSWVDALQVGRDAGVKHAVLFHHDPDSDDAVIDGYLQRAQEEFESVWAAAEGMVLTWAGGRVECASVTPRVGPRSPTRFAGKLRAHREDGSELQALVDVENLTIKGAFVQAAERLPLHSDVELELSDFGSGPVVLGGKVVRCENRDERTRVGIGIVFFHQTKSSADREA
jgi:phosphoribosyl 1,2-cyclic phosphodiesterase